MFIEGLARHLGSAATQLSMDRLVRSKLPGLTHALELRKNSVVNLAAAWGGMYRTKI